MKLEIRNLTFSYHDHQVLKGLNASFESGTMVALLGGNGAGKTTLFRNILGLLKCQSGEILADGRSLSEMTPRERARLIAYIPQESRTQFSYTVFTSVLMGTTAGIKPLGTPGEKETKRTEEALERSGITALRDRGADTLSGGERQLMLSARADAQNAGILLFDEPVSSLDWGNQIRVLRLIRKLSREGALAIVSTHNIQDAMNWADRIILLEDGRIKADGTPDEIATSGILSDFYSMPVKLIRAEGRYLCTWEDEDVVE